MVDIHTDMAGGPVIVGAQCSVPLLILVGIAGSALGSFLNVVMHRLPRRESIVFPGSHCPSCGASISFRDNIPIVSYLLLKGRCRHCSASISWRYPFVELLTALMAPQCRFIQRSYKWERIDLWHSSPLSLGPFPPIGAREVVVPRQYPAPAEGRMSNSRADAASHSSRCRSDAAEREDRKGA